MNIKLRHIVVLFSVTLLVSGCASKPKEDRVYAPNEQLDDVLFNYVTVERPSRACVEEHQQAQVCNVSTGSATYARGECQQDHRVLAHCQKIAQREQELSQVLELNLNCHDYSQPMTDCYRLASQLNALNVRYPNNKRIMMATALVEFELGNMSNSQQLLDNILYKRDAYPEAAVLRSRIAIEEGNLNLARSIVERQLSINPDSAHLYEVQASYYYLEGKYTEALQSIKIAERFMKSDWRINYHRGIIYEAQKQWYKACQEYNQVLKAEPSNRVTRAKLVLLADHADCYVKTNDSVFSYSPF